MTQQTARVLFQARTAERERQNQIDSALATINREKSASQFRKIGPDCAYRDITEAELIARVRLAELVSDSANVFAGV